VAELNSDPPATVVIDTALDSAGAPIVTVSGELDISTAESLERILAPITSEHPERLTFDLSNLRFMDSAGIAVLVGAATKVNSVRLRNPSTVVQRVVEVTGLSDVLPTES
jgi:anti-anti-sigma factor